MRSASNKETQQRLAGQNNTNIEALFCIIDGHMLSLAGLNAIKKDPRIKTLYDDLDRIKERFLGDDENSDRIEELINSILDRIETAEAEFKSEPGIWSVLQPMMNALRWAMGALASLLPVSCFEVKEDCDFYHTSSRPDIAPNAIQNQNKKTYVLSSGYNGDKAIYYSSAAEAPFKKLECFVGEDIEAFFPQLLSQTPETHGKSSDALKALARLTQQAFVHSLQTPLETTSSAMLKESGLLDLGFFRQGPEANSSSDTAYQPRDQ